MINTIAPASLFVRSLAVNSPLVLGAGALIAGVFVGARHLGNERDEVSNTKAFMRHIASHKEVSNDLLLFF